MSTTGPMTREIRPAVPWTWVVSETVAVMFSFSSALFTWRGSVAGTGGRQSVDTADDVGDLLGDLRLAGRVGLAGVHRDEVVGVVRRGLHRLLARRLLRRCGTQQGGLDPRVDVPRQQRIEHLLRARLELVQREDLVLRRGRPCGRRRLVLLDDLEGDEPAILRLTIDRRAVHGRDEVDLVDPAGVELRLEGVEERFADLACVSARGRFREAGPRLRDRAVAERVVRLRLATHGEERDVLEIGRAS